MKVILAVILLVPGAWGAVTNPLTPEPGSPNGPDSYYPEDGNGGYDVANYRLDVHYDPSSRQMSATDWVTARATQSLSSFDLDLVGLTVDSVRVNGQPAQFSRTGRQELVVEPAQPVRTGQDFGVEVGYHGTPGPLVDPVFGPTGWQPEPDGAAYVVGEPESATTWFPVDDTQDDKATMHVNVTVPRGWSVISNGRPGPTLPSLDGGLTYVWNENTPVTPYDSTLGIDKWDITSSTLPDGTPVINAFAPGSTASDRAGAARLPEVLAFLTSKFGPYPVDAAGGVFPQIDLPGSLETLSRPTYDKGTHDVSTIVHENAHQWYGDTTSFRDWKDICLAECFATYSEWMWAAEKEGQSLDSHYTQILDQATPGFWNGKLYDPGPGHEFDAVYRKGPAMLEALRRYMGDGPFSTMLRTWPAAHRNGDATVPQLQQFAQRLTPRDLGGFFAAWVYGTGKPAPEYLSAGPTGR